MCPNLIKKVQLHCPDMHRNADDWAVVSVIALYCASAAAKTEKYAEKTQDVVTKLKTKKTKTKKTCS